MLDRRHSRRRHDSGAFDRRSEPKPQIRDPAADTELLKQFQAEFDRREGLVTALARPLGKPSTLRVADAETPDLFEDITCTSEGGNYVYRWSWHHAVAGEDLARWADSIAAVLQAKTNSSA